MSGKRLLVFMTDAEVATAKRNASYDKAQDICFVAKTNAYALPKKHKAVNATPDDFQFQYRERLQDLFLENDVTDVRCVAPHTLEGLYWLSHWDHWRASSDANGIHVELATYTVAGSSSWFRSEPGTFGFEKNLPRLYMLYVWNQITASLMYTSVFKHVAGVLLKSKKSAVSLGMYRCLAVLASFPNPRSFTFGITNRDSQGSSLGTYLCDPYDAVPMEFTKISKHAYANGSSEITLPLKFRKTTTGVDYVVDPASLFQAPALPGDSGTQLIEAYDPYITCLLANLPLRKYWDLVHDGYLSVACSFNIEDQTCKMQEHFHSHLRHVTSYLDDLTHQGLLLYGSGKTYATNVLSGNCSPWHDTLVLACSNEKIMECFDYSVLYDRYQTRTLVRYCKYPMENTVLLTGYVHKGTVLEVCNATTTLIPAVDTSEACDLGWLSIVDSAAVLKTPIQFSDDGWLTLDARAEVINSPLALSNAFNILESMFGYTPSYVYSVLRSLSRKGCLVLTNHGFNLTPYGYALHKAMVSALNSKSGKEHMDALDAMYVELTESALLDPPEQEDAKQTNLLEYLEKSKSLVSEISKQAKLWKGYKVTVKKRKPGSKVAKKQVYRLHFDRKTKQAWFETRKHKKTYIHAKVLAVTQSTSFGASRVTHSLYDTKLVPGPLGFLKSQVIESPCPDCGTMTYTYKRSPDKTNLLLKCTGCHSTRPAVFQIIDTTNNDSFQNL